MVLVVSIVFLIELTKGISENRDTLDNRIVVVVVVDIYWVSLADRKWKWILIIVL